MTNSQPVALWRIHPLPDSVGVWWEWKLESKSWSQTEVYGAAGSSHLYASGWLCKPGAWVRAEMPPPLNERQHQNAINRRRAAPAPFAARRHPK